MYSFQTTTGIHNMEVEVCFWVKEGGFEGFYVLAQTNGSRLNILPYLSKEQIMDLEAKAQIHYLDCIVAQNELQILNSH